jgi:hypothetical protein
MRTGKYSLMEERSIFKDSLMGGLGRVKWLLDSAVTKASERERLNGREVLHLPEVGPPDTNSHQTKIHALCFFGGILTLSNVCPLGVSGGPADVSFPC